MEVNKFCNKCKLEKRLTEFPKNKNTKSGYYYRCKSCHNITTKELRRKYSSLETKDVEDKKVCCCCKKQKNILEYTKNKCCRDGFAPLCKDCAYKYHNA